MHPCGNGARHRQLILCRLPPSAMGAWRPAQRTTRSNVEPCRRGACRELRRTLAGFGEIVRTTDSLMASASEDGSVKVRSTETLEMLANLEGPHELRTVAASPDGTTLATGDVTGHLRVWTNVLERPRLEAEYPAHDSAIRCVHFINTQTIATGGEDYRLKIWRGRPLRLCYESRHENFVTDFHAIRSQSRCELLVRWRRFLSTPGKKLSLLATAGQNHRTHCVSQGTSHHEFSAPRDGKPAGKPRRSDRRPGFRSAGVPDVIAGHPPRARDRGDGARSRSGLLHDRRRAGSNGGSINQPSVVCHPVDHPLLCPDICVPCRDECGPDGSAARRPRSWRHSC